MSHIGHDILGAAETDYWAAYRNPTYVEYTGLPGIRAVDTIEVRDAEDEDGKWVTVTADDVRDAHHALILKRGGIKGIHPANYAWVTEDDDYDAETGDWVVQHLAFGEVIFG